MIKTMTILLMGSGVQAMADGGHADHNKDQPPVVKNYLHLQTKLASDKAIEKTEVKEFKNNAMLTKSPELISAVSALEKESDIDKQREAFKKVSTLMIAYAKKEKLKGLYHANCPMASADWLQSSAEVKNPYYGSKMLKCGSTKEI